MASGISVSLPLHYDPVDGPYRLNKTLRDSIKQNVKNLFLTSKGERVMIPSFGVGLRQFLFENFNSELANKIETEAYKQVKKYMPFISLQNIVFTTHDELPTLPLNALRVEILYSIPSFGVSDILTIDTGLEEGTI
tara:strand:- start:539 stop:946 length:408 start_codon:yes stop_codon:yes gene_type:complete